MLQRTWTIAALSAVLLGTVAIAPSSADQLSTDKLFVYTQSGIVQGTITPNARLVAEIQRAGVRKKLVNAKASSTGAYSVDLSYNDGIGEGAHNGDTVSVTDSTTAKKYSQVLRLVGLFDERTGTFEGTARPGATVLLQLFRVFDKSRVVATKTVVADFAGNFRFAFASVHTPAPTSDRPAWRGYTVTLDSRDVTGQGVYRSIQTPAPTLNWTLNQGGGGYFKPGDTVIHELWNADVLRASVTSIVNDDGIPRSLFPVDVIDGDVFRSRYHDTSGLEQTVDLNPWNFTAVVDPTTKTVRGRTEPNAPVSGLLKNNATPELQKTRADLNGNYELRYAAMDAGAQLLAHRVADPSFTGIGVQGLTLHTPSVRVNDLNGEVTGYGAAGRTAVTARVERGSAVTSAAVGTTTRGGKYSLTVPFELLAGDRVAVTTGPQALPVAEIEPFTAHRRAFTSTAPFEGTGPAGRQVRVQSAACLVSGIAGAFGWSASGTCGFAPTELVQVSYGPAAPAYDGWSVGRFEWVTAPDPALTAPLPGAALTGPVTIKADAFDYDDNKAPAEVHFYVDGKVVAVDAVAPYSTTVTLAAGTHQIWVHALDSARRKDASATVIYGATPIRTIAVS